MRRFVPLVVLLLAGTWTAAAQVQFGIGIRAGMNFGTASFDPEIYNLGSGINKVGRTGIMVGAVSELNFARMFAVELSPTFVMKGGGYEDAKGGQDIAKYSELEIPILFKVKFLTGSIRPYAFVGPNLGLLLSATRTLGSAGNVQDIDIKKDAAGLDFALDFGGGAEFMAARNIGLLADVRYSLGLTNMFSPQQGTAAQSIKNRGFQIMVGSLFYL